MSVGLPLEAKLMFDTHVTCAGQVTPIVCTIAGGHVVSVVHAVAEAVRVDVHGLCYH